MLMLHHFQSWLYILNGTIKKIILIANLIFLLICCLHFRIITFIMTKKWVTISGSSIKHAFIPFIRFHFSIKVYKTKSKPHTFSGEKLFFINFLRTTFAFISKCHAVTMRPREEKKVNNGFCWYSEQQDVEYQPNKKCRKKNSSRCLCDKQFHLLFEIHATEHLLLRLQRSLCFPLASTFGRIVKNLH